MTPAPKLQRSRPGGSSGIMPTLTAAVEAPVVGTPPANQQTVGVPDYRSPELTESRAEARKRSQAEQDAGEAPRYLQMVRKESRLRMDQVDALAVLTRQLARQRTRRGGERLTDNTLIRIAVDLLLDRADRLKGNTEDELLASLKDVMNR
ncbi:hypothetical protein [Pilimelia columellifera]|uniref:Uncharacterized protein n=1 Tax=Pilimelia columellifera subsp. columellifera TaxID=706583 RepID=A0ABN3NQX5_9ACTN